MMPGPKAFRGFTRRWMAGFPGCIVPAGESEGARGGASRETAGSGQGPHFSNMVVTPSHSGPGGCWLNFWIARR